MARPESQLSVNDKEPALSENGESKSRLELGGKFKRPLKYRKAKKFNPLVQHGRTHHALLRV
jgi:hypothetical protein